MSEERLSQVQRTILEELYHTKVLKGGSASSRHRVTLSPFFGQRVDENFKSTFSRSLRNLEDKGLVDLDKGYRRIVAGSRKDIVNT